MSTEADIVKRRFGSRHEKPCSRPSVLTCALWECQKAGECRLPALEAAAVIATEGDNG